MPPGAVCPRWARSGHRTHLAAVSCLGRGVGVVVPPSLHTMGSSYAGAQHAPEMCPAPQGYPPFALLPFANLSWHSTACRKLPSPPGGSKRWLCSPGHDASLVVVGRRGGGGLGQPPGAFRGHPEAAAGPCVCRPRSALCQHDSPGTLPHRLPHQCQLRRGHSPPSLHPLGEQRGHGADQPHHGGIVLRGGGTVPGAHLSFQSRLPSASLLPAATRLLPRTSSARVLLPPHLTPRRGLLPLAWHRREGVASHCFWHLAQRLQPRSDPHPPWHGPGTGLGG